MPLFIDALKEYNKTETKWTVPKKGTDDYKKVIEIMNKIKMNAPKAEPKAKAPKKAKVPKKAREPKPKVPPLKTDTTLRG